MATALLAGKTAVVTGAAGTLGLAAVRALLEDGAQVGLVDVDAMRLDSLIRFLRGTTISLPCDVTDAGAVRQSQQQLEKLLGPVDILVNAASVPAPERTEAMGEDDWRRAFAVQVEGAVHWSRAALPGMRKRGWGRILMVGGLGLADGAAWAGARGALVQLTRSLARETAGSGITVNAIAASFVKSPAVEQMNEAQRRQVLAQVPLGRFCEPEEFSHAVRYLLAPLAGFATGTVLELDGGRGGA